MKKNQLEKTIENYLAWMSEISRSRRTIQEHAGLLKHFRIYVEKMRYPFEKAVDLETVDEFLSQSSLIKAPHALNGFMRYLGKEREHSRKYNQRLPEVFESYIYFFRRTRSVKESRISMIRKRLADFNDFLIEKNIQLKELEIHAVDDFLDAYNKGYAASTRSDNRSAIKGFLSWIYNERKITKRDLSSMIISAPVFNRDNPPKYLRPNEISCLVGSMEYSTPEALRSNAVVMLAYTSGLRPREIITITLDDISFKKSELRVLLRKGGNPVIFTLPDDVIKAISAYIIGARPEAPKTRDRHLFLSLEPPYSPVSRYAIHGIIQRAMQKAGVPGTPYWLRHTYAQNLLESGADIFEIKEMLGHDDIKSTKRYLHIHIKLMREVLFDETENNL